MVQEFLALSITLLETHPAKIGATLEGRGLLALVSRTLVGGVESVLALVSSILRVGGGCADLGV